LAAYRKRTTEWQSRGAPVDILDAAAAAELLGTSWYKGAYLDRRGGRLHPLSYARGLARAGLRQGAEIFGHTLVREVKRAGRGFHVKTENGVVASDQVLLCTNAYTDMSGSRRLWPGLATSVVPVLSYMIATEPLGDNLRWSILPSGHTAADLKRLTNHFRLEPDGRFLFGGRGGLSESGGPKSFEPLLIKLRECFPQLADARVDYQWAGKVALTLDHLPHLHELQPGLIAALGCNGRGVGMASNIGKVVADLMLGGEARDCPVPVTRLKPIPFHRLRLPAMQAAIWWKAHRDRAEHRRA
jgi:glycine/D-amino acid oxidase-like deaminating enzyme